MLIQRDDRGDEPWRFTRRGLPLVDLVCKLFGILSLSLSFSLRILLLLRFFSFNNFFFIIFFFERSGVDWSF